MVKEINQSYNYLTCTCRYKIRQIRKTIITKLPSLVYQYTQKQILYKLIEHLIWYYIHVHDVIGDVQRQKDRKTERQKDRKKERHLRQWKNENESCLRWDSNGQHSVLRTDALPTELPR